MSRHRPQARDATQVTTAAKPRARSLQWSVAILASLAFAVSIYSLTQDETAGVTILREKVIETVTVTTEQPTLSVARTDSSRDHGDNRAVLGFGHHDNGLDDQGEPSATTDSTVAGPSTTTTLP